LSCVAVTSYVARSSCSLMVFAFFLVLFRAAVLVA